MRKRRKINPKKVNEKQVFLFFEWDTEKCYFSQIKNIFNLRNLKVKDILWQVSGKNLWWIKSKQKKIYENIEFNKNDLKSTKSKIFYLLDIDWNNKHSYSQNEIDFIKTNLEDSYIKVFFSNKDFELWILLHFEEYKKEDWKYIDEITKIIKKEYKKWNCNIDFFRKIIKENLKIARENWKKLEKYQKSKSLNLKDKNPYTEVYKIFDELEI